MKYSKFCVEFYASIYFCLPIILNSFAQLCTQRLSFEVLPSVYDSTCRLAPRRLMCIRQGLQEPKTEKCLQSYLFSNLPPNLIYAKKMCKGWMQCKQKAILFQKKDSITLNCVKIHLCEWCKECDSSGNRALIWHHDLIVKSSCLPL